MPGARRRRRAPARSPRSTANASCRTAWWCGCPAGTPRSWSSASLGRLLEQLASDQHPADLAGAGADLVELGVAQQAARRVIVDIAVAAEELDRIERDLRRLLARIQDGAGRVLARGLALIARLGHRIDVGLARVHGDVHVGDLALDQLERADRLAELLALVHVRKHRVEAGLHNA